MKFEKFSSCFKGLFFRIFIAILCLSIAGPTINTATADPILRSQIDRPDDQTGFQIHLVYVVPKGSNDLKFDTNGQIDSWVKEGNDWLYSKVGRRIKFDFFQEVTDVSFLQSKFSVSELCNSCETNKKLKEEYVSQNLTFDDSKTLFFVVGDNLDKNSCGWGGIGNLAIAHDLANLKGGCNSAESKAKRGISWPAYTITHELFHTFGIKHVCQDKSDLMLGTPECTIDKSTFGQVLTTLDFKSNQYVGSESAFGIDILKMPIWSDNSGTYAYAEVNQISDTKFLPRLANGKIYAIVGQESKAFAWDWQRNFYPNLTSVKCQLSSMGISILGRLIESSCVFEIPKNWRPGNPFTVTQSWTKGPWHGSAYVSGTLARQDLTITPCSNTVCYAGGKVGLMSSYCTSFPTDVILQQLIDNKWINKVSVQQQANGLNCIGRNEYYSAPDYTLNFEVTGTYIYRWFKPAERFISGYVGAPFAVLVNDVNAPEPDQSEIDAAQVKASELGKAADDATKSASNTPMNSEVPKKTITCLQGKVVKKVTGVNPKCPSGYKKK